ncbi:MAG: NADH-quinone oxidoreductase subunit A [Pseudomonadota bacterium]
MITELFDKIYIGAFIIGGFLFAIGPFVASFLLAPKTKNPKTKNVYECGMDPLGPSWVRYGANYYLYALIFLAFDVDVLYLFPVAAAWGQDFNMREVAEVIIFVAILSLAIVYAWAKGAFKWERKVLG